MYWDREQVSESIPEIIGLPGGCDMLLVSWPCQNDITLICMASFSQCVQVH